MVSPPQIGEGIKNSPFYDAFSLDPIERSKQFPKYYKMVAEKKGCIFFDAAEYVYPSEFDSLYLTPQGHETLAQKFKEVILSIK